MSKGSNAAKQKRLRDNGRRGQMRGHSKWVRRMMAGYRPWSSTIDQDDHERWMVEGQRNMVLEEIKA